MGMPQQLDYENPLNRAEPLSIAGMTSAGLGSLSLLMMILGCGFSLYGYRVYDMTFLGCTGFGMLCSIYGLVRSRRRGWSYIGLLLNGLVWCAFGMLIAIFYAIGPIGPP